MAEGFKRKYPQIGLLIGLLLILAILVAYIRIINCNFVSFDDRLYVTNNRQVQTGLTAENLVWAFTTFHAANWHPLTWLSHMLDFQLYGLNPKGHHWTNLQLHIANTLLLFFILQQMTGTLWRSAFVAALFGLHPLHVESVAWVAERKDVLSTFWGLLAIIAYYRYVKQRRLFYYLLVIVLLGLGLMSKPMLVTLPLVLLLLDFWPLGRLQLGSKRRMQLEGETHFNFQALPDLIYEKIPLFVLVACSGVVTYLAQRSGGALDTLASLPLSVRGANAFVSYLKYIAKAIWPAHLIVFYPHPGDALPLWQGIGAALLIIGVSLAVIRMGRQYPYVTVGWLWYLVTLLPVIGLLQIGGQALADRYTYLPLTGIFIMVAWGIPDLLAQYRFRKIVMSVSAAIILAAFSARTYIQVGHWYSAVSLFENAVAVTPDNDLAHHNLGTALYETGQLNAAVFHFKKALEIRPGYIDALNNLGAAYYQLGNYDAAVLYLQKVLAEHPQDAMAHDNLGKVLFAEQKIDEAVRHFAEAVRINPLFADAHNNLANVLAVTGKFKEATHHFSKAIRIDPKYSEAHYNFGNLLLKQQKIKEAFAHLIAAIKIDPENARAYHQIGMILSREGKYKTAEAYLTKALQIDPGYRQARQSLNKLKTSHLKNTSNSQLRRRGPP